MKQPKLFWTLVILSSLGLLFSTRLLLLDYTVLAGQGMPVECNLNATFNCSAVARSSYAFLAGIPVAAWGLLGYMLVLLWLGFNRQRDLRLPLLLVYSLFSGISIYYFAVTKFQLRVICLYCLFTYLINGISTILLIGASLRPPPARFQENLGLSLPVMALAGLLSLLILLPAHRVFQGLAYSQTNQPAVPSRSTPAPGYPPGNFNTQTLQASIGPDHAPVVVEVFSDYQCPYCAEFEPLLQQALREFKQLKVIRREFPLDKNCNRLMGGRQLHAAACEAAYFAKCAGLQGKFWAAASLLHQQHASLSARNWTALAKILELNRNALESCMQAPATRNAVLGDIQEGIFKGVDSTPVWYLNGEKQVGLIPYPQFREKLRQAGLQP